MKIASGSATYILNRFFGICSEKQIGQTVSRAAKKLAMESKLGQPLNVSTASKVFAMSMPTGVKQPIITSSGEEAANFISENWAGTPKLPGALFDLMESASTIVGSKDSALIFIPNNPWFQRPLDFISATIHEFRHYLDIEKSSILTPIKRFSGKILQKLNPKTHKPTINTKLKSKFDNIQDMLASICNLSDLSGRVKNGREIKYILKDKSIITFFRRFLRQELADVPISEKIKLLKQLKPKIKTEAEAYKAGGLATKLLRTGNSSPDEFLEISEIIGLNQEKMLDAINKEISMLKNPRYKKHAPKIMSPDEKLLSIRKPEAVKKLRKVIEENLQKE
ncbi:MAG: hypothetical protein K6A44_00080 [bacterium]|nr:hypothetical protein [bacterium]